MDEDGRLRTVYLSISPRGQQTVHLMDEFGRWTKNIILGGQVDGFLTMDRPLHERIRAKDYNKIHQMDGGRRTDEWIDERSTIFREDYI